MNNSFSLHLGEDQKQVDQRLDRWTAQNFARRIWEKDPCLWHPQPLPEITDRLGWLALPEMMAERCDDILSFAREIKEERYSHVLLLGMGGSSLAPEVFQKTFRNAPGFPELIVCDSTHPEAVRAVENRLNPAHTLFLVSSKSGTTLETISLFKYFWDRASAAHDRPGSCFAAITDAGSPLERLAGERNFRRTFLPPSDVGGRYSAFTEFGIVPGALIGLDILKLLANGRTAANSSRSPGAEKNAPGFILGAALGELALHHRDKLTIWTTSGLSGFPPWLEQLLAESTGKERKGLIPVVAEPFVTAEGYGRDRIFVGLFLDEDPGRDLDRHLSRLEDSGHPTIRISLKEKLDLGLEIFSWELATASAGAVLGIQPFDQPDVQLTKELTRSAMEKDKGATETVPDSPEYVSTGDEKACVLAIEDFVARAAPGDYVAVQAYLSPIPEITAALEAVRSAIFKRTRLATTTGFGPRFLHSTGQLHKGGPNTVLAIQLVDDPARDIPVPGTDYSFASLIRAQAAGDYSALRRQTRRVLPITLGQDVSGGLQKLIGFFTGRE